jgi:hypothetical protein
MSNSLITIFNLDLPWILGSCEQKLDTKNRSSKSERHPPIYKQNIDDFTLKEKPLHHHNDGLVYKHLSKSSGIYILYEYPDHEKTSLIFQILTFINEYENTGWKFGRYHRDTNSNKPTYIGHKPMTIPTGVIMALPSNFYDEERKFNHTSKPKSFGDVKEGSKDSSKSVGVSKSVIGNETEYNVHNVSMMVTILGKILKDLLYRWRPMSEDEFDLLPHYNPKINTDDKCMDNNPPKSVEREKRLFFVYEIKVTPNFMNILRSACVYFKFSKEDLFFDYNWYLCKESNRIFTHRPYFIVKKDMVKEVKKRLPFRCLSEK